MKCKYTEFGGYFKFLALIHIGSQYIHIQSHGSHCKDNYRSIPPLCECYFSVNEENFRLERTNLTNKQSYSPNVDITPFKRETDLNLHTPKLQILQCLHNNIQRSIVPKYF